MKSQINEQAFEATVETMLQGVGWKQGDPLEWDYKRAIFPKQIIKFLKRANPNHWNTLKARIGNDLQTQVVNNLVKELNFKGTLHVLRHGFKFDGLPLEIAQFKPAHSLNAETEKLFALNELTVTRQVRCHPKKRTKVDLLFALNGLPIATCELKNPLTNQTWRDAIKQYKRKRDPKAPLFRHKSRALVHFAADPYEVHMTTKLAGNNTRFLPFNRGSQPEKMHCGAGNPSHPSGYPTGYFWQEVLERESFLNILGSFMFINEDKKAIFPRYHQLDAVKKLVEAAKKDGPGHNYLIQHSAGSGKTISISLLSHQLSTLHNAKNKKIFDCVLVITDRRILDHQLRDAIYEIDHVQGVVKAIEKDSKQLAEALIDGTKIVITTLQKFPFVMEQLSKVSSETSSDLQKQIAGRRYALIVDEAHSSQSGKTAREMKTLLGKGPKESTDDSTEGQEDLLPWEDELIAELEARGPQANLSFFAFTATPKNKTIELFGTKNSKGISEAFHVYSMRQAIEEGFILDVLSNYTDYNTYYKFVESATEDPDVDVERREAAKALQNFMKTHPENYVEKTEIIVEHFRDNVRRLIGGNAKAMVVTSSRLDAVRYKQAFEKYITEKGYEDVRPLVAFSGTVRDPKTGEEFTEPSMNFDEVSGRTISEAELPSKFDSPEYQILIVAEKYQTGFDQPLLQAMYVDKSLDGVQAVQTLSRLNRTADKKVKPFVLDFVNNAESIGNAFAPYYDTTFVEGTTDLDQPERLKRELLHMGVIDKKEVRNFCQVYFDPNLRSQNSQPAKQTHKEIVGILEPARARFNELTKEEQAKFHALLSKFIRSHSFVGQILPHSNVELEKLFVYGRALIRTLRSEDSNAIIVEDLVELESIRLEVNSTGAIVLGEGDVSLVSAESQASSTPEEEIVLISEIIASFNEVYDEKFGPAEEKFLDNIISDTSNDTDLINYARTNPMAKFRLLYENFFIQQVKKRKNENPNFARCLHAFTKIRFAAQFAGFATTVYNTLNGII